MKLDKLVDLVCVLSLAKARAEIYFPGLDFRKKS